MTNPWRTHDLPMTTRDFFMGLDPSELDGFSSEIEQFWRVFSESSEMSEAVKFEPTICMSYNFYQVLIFVGLPTSNYQTSWCWAKVCISRCGPGWGVILETQGFQKKHRVFFETLRILRVRRYKVYIYIFVIYIYYIYLHICIMNICRCPSADASQYPQSCPHSEVFDRYVCSLACWISRRMMLALLESSWRRSCLALWPWGVCTRK